MSGQDQLSCNIRKPKQRREGTFLDLLDLFATLQDRLHTHNQAETLLKLCKIALAVQDGKLIAPHSRLRIQVVQNSAWRMSTGK